MTAAFGTVEVKWLGSVEDYVQRCETATGERRPLQKQRSSLLLTLWDSSTEVGLKDEPLGFQAVSHPRV